MKKSLPVISIIISLWGCLGISFIITSCISVKNANSEERFLSYALCVAKTLKKSDDKVEAFTEIAIKYAQEGNQDKASCLLSQAVEIAKRIENINEKWELSVWNDIVDGYAKSGIYNKSLISEITKDIEKTNDKARAFAEIAIRYANSGNNDKASQLLSQAVEIASTISDNHNRADVLYNIAGDYAIVGLYAQAITLAKTIEDDGYKRFAFNSIANKCEAAGQSRTFVNIARTIKDIKWKAIALAEIAVKYGQAEDDDKATELLCQAFNIAKRIEDADLKDEVLIEIAVKHVEAEQYNRVISIVNAIGHSEHKDTALSEIAGRYAEAGLYDQAIEVAMMLKNPELSALAGTAMRCAEVGKNDKAVEIVNMIKDIGNKDWALCEIACKHIEYWKALDLIEKIKDDGEKAIALAMIAVKYAHAGQKKKASQLLGQAVKTANLIKNTEGKVHRIRRIKELAKEVSSVPDLDINQRLLIACMSDNLEYIKILIDKGADINFNGKYKYSETHSRSFVTAQGPLASPLLSPLTAAVWSGNLNLVKFLFKNGANPNDGICLNYACWGRNIHILDYLLKQGADPQKRHPETGNLPFTGSVSSRIVEEMKLLLEHGADVNSTDKDGLTPLMLAAYTGKKNVLELLLKNGADINAICPLKIDKGGPGGNALITAVNYECLDAVKILLANGADVNFKTNNGWTALKLAQHELKNAEESWRSLEYLKKINEIVQILQQAETKK